MCIGEAVVQWSKFWHANLGSRIQVPISAGLHWFGRVSGKIVKYGICFEIELNNIIYIEIKLK